MPAPAGMSTARSGGVPPAPPVTPPGPGPAGAALDRAVACPCVFGAVGAMAVGVSSRLLLPALFALGGATAGSVVLGTVGLVLGAGTGLMAGLRAERKTHAGRFLGGMAGGSLGFGLGKVAEKLGVQPSETMVRETAGFSLRSLPGKLLDPEYTSHPLLTPEKSAEGKALVQPGDVILTSHDGNFNFELAQKVLGRSGDWTHVALVDEQRRLVEVLIQTDGPTLSPLERAFDQQHHVAILRPRYRGPDSITKTLDFARSEFGKVRYDHGFSMITDDKQYCQEYILKALRHGAPELELKPARFLGREYVCADDFLNSPDLEVVWSTGSNFWLNGLSKFT